MPEEAEPGRIWKKGRAILVSDHEVPPYGLVSVLRLPTNSPFLLAAFRASLWSAGMLTALQHCHTMRIIIAVCSSRSRACRLAMRPFLSLISLFFLSFSGMTASIVLPRLKSKPPKVGDGGADTTRLSSASHCAMRSLMPAVKRCERARILE